MPRSWLYHFEMAVRIVFVVGALALSSGGCARHEAATRDTPVASASASGSEPAPVQRVRAVGQLGPGRGTLVISLLPPKAGKLTEGAPLSVEARGAHLIFPDRVRGKLQSERLPLRIPVDVTDGATGPAEVDLSYYWCGSSEGAACHPERAKLVVELDVTGDAPGGEAHVTHVAAGS